MDTVGTRGHPDSALLIPTLSTQLAIVKRSKADISSVNPSSERLEELWVVCGFICIYLQSVIKSV